MEERQKQVMLPQHEVPAQKEQAYTWSTLRVAEGVAINVASVIAIAVLTAVVTFLPSLLLLLIQQVFHFLLIPTNLLAIVAYFAGAVLFVLLIGIGLLYLFVRKHPVVILVMLLGALFGVYIESNLPKVDFSKPFIFTPKEPNNPTNTENN